MRPVLRRITRSSLRARRRSHMAAVRRSCHTMALQIGSPVARSQTTVVSRWFVMPIPEISDGRTFAFVSRSEEHTSELQSHVNLVCRLLLEKKKQKKNHHDTESTRNQIRLI